MNMKSVNSQKTAHSVFDYLFCRKHDIRPGRGHLLTNLAHIYMNPLPGPKLLDLSLGDFSFCFLISFAVKKLFSLM